MWEKVFRNQIKGISKGWSVQNARNKVWLRVRKSNANTQSVLLPFSWQENNVSNVLIRVRNIYNLTLDGNDLKTAAFLAENKNNKLLNNLDWNDAAKRFKNSLTNVAPITWKNKYEAAINEALYFLTQTRKINNAADLTDKVLQKWIGKT